ncbi:MAG: hypothetical protein RBT45_02970 [Acholeplasmataceae bacterium]|jgi:hypothetical protein|nr:hypothetical protein [Acholeplasmataceae bacterium]
MKKSKITGSIFLGNAINVFLVVMMIVASVISPLNLHEQMMVQHPETFDSELSSTDDLINLALELSDYWADEYIDYDYIQSANLSIYQFESMDDGGGGGASQTIPTQEEDLDLFVQQTMQQVYDDLSVDDQQVLEEIALSNHDVNNMLRHIDHRGFTVMPMGNYQQSNLSGSALDMTMNYLQAAQLSALAISAIKGSFAAMVSALKMIFVPTSVKLAIAVLAIIVITVVVVANWRLIEPYFQDIVKAFADSAASLGNSIRNVFDQVFAKANVNYDKRDVTAAYAATWSIPLTSRRVYYIAYLTNQLLYINRSYALNYAEAYSVLIASGIINVISGALFTRIPLNSTLTSYANTLKGLGISKSRAGVYTYQQLDAAKLAYSLGGYYNSRGGYLLNEIHDKRIGSGFYYHFHDAAHTIHVWYGNAQ